MPAKKTETKPEENTQLQKNVRFYHQFMTTPKDAQKSFNNGSFSGTDINPMWRIKVLTEVFGPSGFGWWTGNVRYKFESCEITNEIHVFCELDLYVKDPETGEVSQPIYGIGGNTYVKNWGNNRIKASDEAMKMAYTDALSIACKSLGIGHDIWYSNDKTKYTMPNDAPEPAKPQVKLSDTQPAPVPPAHTADTAAVIKEIDDKITQVVANMQKEEKIEFAQTKIIPIIGQANYKVCTDITKLIALRDSLCA